jgi:hypothetical protein
MPQNLYLGSRFLSERKITNLYTIQINQRLEYHVNKTNIDFVETRSPGAVEHQSKTKLRNQSQRTQTLARGFTRILPISTTNVLSARTKFSDRLKSGLAQAAGRCSISNAQNSGMKTKRKPLLPGRLRDLNASLIPGVAQLTDALHRKSHSLITAGVAKK